MLIKLSKLYLKFKIIVFVYNILEVNYMYYIIIAILCVLLLKYDYICTRHQNKRVGKAGENKVKQQLAKLSTDYQVINDYHLCGRQIDHIVCKGNLIYVIETKNWHGILRGDIADKYLNLSGKSVYNPFFQNDKHCQVVKLRYPCCMVVSVICFAGHCKLNVSNLCKSDAIILSVNNLLPYIFRTSCDSSL